MSVFVDVAPPGATRPPGAARFPGWLTRVALPLLSLLVFFIVWELAAASGVWNESAQPILRRMGVETTVRPSFAFYNTVDEIDVFLRAVRRIAEGAANSG